MSSRNRRGHQHPQPPGGEFWLLLAMAVLIATIALLHLAVERERAAGTVQFEFQNAVRDIERPAGTGTGLR
ncbi:uncharacterized protein (UPF0333 family) [Variovorax sp. SG517]|uniref:hypothetical protein n=1 Tax=Variovorax sp. SG517 TaxID=2587117 RepID=UPI00159D5001|nr:hypothetical protein [Variovorax sp. SG517]NVM92585.1 uncharacterized protein (UPF0333 family) [Variovorax sp. SG517]